MILTTIFYKTFNLHNESQIVFAVLIRVGILIFTIEISIAFVIVHFGEHVLVSCGHYSCMHRAVIVPSPVGVFFQNMTKKILVIRSSLAQSIKLNLSRFPPLVMGHVTTISVLEIGLYHIPDSIVHIKRPGVVNPVPPFFHDDPLILLDTSHYQIRCSHMIGLRQSLNGTFICLTIFSDLSHGPENWLGLVHQISP